jgi:hypothetical protein
MNPTPTAPLEVVLTLPPAPLTLATGAFLSTLSAVEQEIASTPRIDTPEAAQQAANIQSRLTSAGSALEKQRKALKQPFIDAGKAIDAAATEPAARIEAAKGKVKRLLTDYDDRERAKAAEAERARQAELARLAKIAAEEKAEADRKAQEAADALAKQAEAARAAMPDVEVMEFDDTPEPIAPQKTETQKAIEQLQHAPVVVAPRPAGVVMRTTLIATVKDVNLLPDVFVDRVPKLAAIRATFCTKYVEDQPLPVCAGVEFRVERTPVSTGR